jgi:hypothetical protein
LMSWRLTWATEPVDMGSVGSPDKAKVWDGQFTALEPEAGAKVGGAGLEGVEAEGTAVGEDVTGLDVTGLNVAGLNVLGLLVVTTTVGATVVVLFAPSGAKVVVDGEDVVGLEVDAEGATVIKEQAGYPA